MESLGQRKLDEINLKRSKTKLNLDDEIKDPNKCKNDGVKSRQCDSLQLSAFPRTKNVVQPLMLPLLRIPKVEDWCSNTSIALTGTASRGGIGPPVGTVDIGISKSAYYFCIALPGVKKDPGEFSIEIQRDGRVCIKGITSTGGKTVSKYSRVFEMKFQQQCPPGPFTLFFSLLGPVDPRLFSPTFRSDGIFEGVIAKYE